MEILFWLLLLAVLYTYLGYPLLLILLSTFIRRPVRAGEGHRPAVSLLVAAHNEEAVIGEKVENSLALDYPPALLEIAVASDGSTDRTAEIVAAYGRQGVKLFHYPQRRGKVAVLNESVPRLSGEVIVFSDASVFYAADALSRLVRSFADPEVGGVWGDKVYRNPGKVVSGEGESLYLRYEKFSKRRETLLGSIVSAEGSMLAIRRSLFRSIPDPAVSDDYYLSALVRDRGMRLVYDPQARSWENVAPSRGGEYRRKVRIIQRGLRGFWLMRHLANPLRTGVYSVQILSRQLLRRAVAALFPLLLLLNLAIFLRRPSLLYGLPLAGQLALLLLAAGGAIVRAGRARLPFLLYAPYYLVMVNAAALHGMWNWLSGREAARWEPTGRG